jgi:hypothetical protein
VSELDFMSRGALGNQVAPASTTPETSESSGKS